jgi:hypothetical protein
MKPFRINRKSWHYQLNRYFFNHYTDWMSQWEASHNNFCSYWRATLFRSIFATLLAAICIIILTALGISIYQHPIEFATAVILAVATLTFIFGGATLIRYSIERFKNRSAAETTEKPEGLFAQRYRAYKDKVCPAVEYDK